MFGTDSAFYAGKVHFRIYQTYRRPPVIGGVGVRSNFNPFVSSVDEVVADDVSSGQDHVRLICHTLHLSRRQVLLWID